MRFRRFVPIVAVALLFAIPSFAQRPRPARFPVTGVAEGAFDPAIVAPCLSVLALTDAQKVQIQQILASDQPSLDALAAQIRGDRGVLDSAVAGGSSNSCNIGTAFLQLDSDQRALATELASLRTNIEAVLTPDQKAKLDGCIATLAGFGQRP